MTLFSLSRDYFQLRKELLFDYFEEKLSSIVLNFVFLKAFEDGAEGNTSVFRSFDVFFLFWFLC